MTKSKSAKKLDDTLPDELREAVKKAEAGEKSVQDSSVVEDKSNKAEQAGAKLEGDESESSEQGVKQQPKGGKSMAELTKEDIRKEVEAIFSEKDSKAATEARLTTLDGEKSELSRKLVEAQAANQDLASKVTAAEEQFKTKEEESKALAKEKDDALTAAAATKKELDGIHAEQALAARKFQLAEAKILFVDAEKQKKQLEKVMAMSDEVFATYKDELVEVMELGKASQAPVAVPAPAIVPETPVVAQATASAEGEEEILSAVISDGEAFRRTMASVQDVKIDDSQVAVYAQM